MRKKIIMILSCFIFALIFSACQSQPKQLTEDEYNKKSVEFNSIYDSNVEDFYKQCEVVLAGGKTNSVTDDSHKNDIDKLTNIFKNYDENLVPKDKIKDFKNKEDIASTMYAIELDLENKVNIESASAKRFVSLVEKYKSKVEGVFDDTKSINISAIKDINKPDLELLDEDTINENGTIYITGSIKNNSSSNYQSVSVYFDLYDENMNKVGDSMDIINGLNTGETWKFKALTTKDFAKYKLARIDGI